MEGRGTDLDFEQTGEEAVEMFCLLQGAVTSRSRLQGGGAGVITREVGLEARITESHRITE